MFNKKHQNRHYFYHFYQFLSYEVFQRNDIISFQYLSILSLQLFKLGFRHIDALDPSEGMLKKAKERGIYNNFFQDFIGVDSPVPVDNGKLLDIFQDKLNEHFPSIEFKHDIGNYIIVS